VTSFLHEKEKWPSGNNFALMDVQVGSTVTDDAPVLPTLKSLYLWLLTHDLKYKKCIKTLTPGIHSRTT